MTRSLLQRWRKLDDQGRQQASLLFMLCLAYTLHYLVYCIIQPFFIEDAAITFAYSRNLAEGEGLVPFPGAERVEGFSNPLWTFLIAGWYGLGISVWTSAKWMGALFGMAALPPIYWLCLAAGAPRKWAWLAPLVLVLSPNFVIWNASGLENSLYVMCLAWGMYRLVAESEKRDRYPISALWFCAACMTRPEGMMYAALAVFARIVFALIDRRWLALFRWLLVFSVPFGLYQYWRYNYFAWPFPNTYYAKLGTGRRFKPFGWTVRGWKYVNEYFASNTFAGEQKVLPQLQTVLSLGLAYMLPLLIVAMTGLRRYGRACAVTCTLWLATVVLWNGKLSFAPEFWHAIESKWIHIRVLSILVVAVLVGLMSLGRAGWRARSVLWSMGSASMFFVIYSGGDWMKAHRWFNIVELFMLPVLALGLIELLQRIDGFRFNLSKANEHPALRLIAAAAIVSLLVYTCFLSGLSLPLSFLVAGLLALLLRQLSSPPLQQRSLPILLVRYFTRFLSWLKSQSLASVVLTVLLLSFAAIQTRIAVEFVGNPETSVSDIHRRVKYMSWAQRRLDVDNITLLDVDMGAHMYYSGWRIVDIAGLIDVPIARHSDYNNRFIKEYIFAEQNPDFAHVHGGWARTSRINKKPEWKKRYIEIPGYPIGNRRLHIGNHIRKDLFISTRSNKRWPDQIRYEDGFTLLGWEVTSPTVPAGGLVYVETHWQNAAERTEDVQVLIGLVQDGELRSVSAFQPGYRWYDLKDWKAAEQVRGNFLVTVPKDLDHGNYSLWLTVIDQQSGHCLSTTRTLDDGQLEVGEILWQDLGTEISVVPRKTATAAAEEDRKHALTLLSEGECDAGWLRWKQGTRHLQRRRSYREKYETQLRDARAQCHLQRAREFDQAGKIAERDQQIIDARLWNHRTDGLNAYATQIAAAIDEQGQHLRSKEDWQGAYDAFALAMKLDPSRSWTRRQAEEMRDKRLKITPPYKKKKKKSAARPPLRKTDRPEVKPSAPGSKKSIKKAKKSGSSLSIPRSPSIKKPAKLPQRTELPKSDEGQEP